MKIFFMGTPEFSATILSELYNHFEILGVCTKEDKLVGRKQLLTKSRVKIKAEALGIKHIFSPKSLKDAKLLEEIAALKPDFIIVAAYGKILPPKLLQISTCINIHTSLLPKYRGASPIQAAILAGDETSGVTTMLMDAGLDTGDILAQTSVDIRGKSCEELFTLFADLGAKLAIKTIKDFPQIKPIKQDESKASKCKMIEKSLGKVDFKDAREVYQKYLALHPWPGLFLENGLKLLNIKLIDTNEACEAGKILKINKLSFIIGCTHGKLELFTLQPAGKKPMDAKSFLNGRKLGVGDILN